MIFEAVRDGMSETARALNDGAPADPVGAANTVPAVCEAKEAVSVPVVVTGDPETVKIAGRESATLVTVPGCAPAAIPASLVKSAEDMKPATVLFAAACKVPPPLLPWLVSVKRVAGSVPVDRSLALPEVAIEARPVIVLAACVPVCVALSRSCASVALAVAPAAIPASFVKSVDDMKPDTVVLASGCV